VEGGELGGQTALQPGQVLQDAGGTVAGEAWRQGLPQRR
jgi:hypothetical protein